MAGARKSAFYILASGIFLKIVNLAGSIFIARILFPEDFGYLLIAMIFSSFIAMIGNMGYENFYLQEKIDNAIHENEILNITFKLRILTNILLFLIQIGISFIVEYIYSNEVIAELLRVFSLSLLINSATQINIYILRKKIDYKPESVAKVYGGIANVSVKIIFALMGFGALSFAFGAVAGSLIKMLVILKYQSFKPNLYSWNNDIFKRVFYFGKHSFFAGIMTFFGEQTDKIMISWFFPVKNIGEYAFANSQSSSLFAMTIFSTGNLLVSLSAKYKNSRNALEEKFEILFYGLAMISIPLSIVASFYSYEIITTVFGEKWSGSVSIFSLFIIKLMFISFASPYMGIITGFGHPEIKTKIVLWRTICIALISFIAILYYQDLYLYACIYSVFTIFFVYYQAYRGMLLLGFDFFKIKKFIFFILFIISLIYTLLNIINIILKPFDFIDILLVILIIGIIYINILLLFFNTLVQKFMMILLPKEHRIIYVIKKWKVLS